MFKKITFWNKVQMSVQAVLSVTQLSLIFSDSQHIYNVLVSVGQIATILIPIWFEDKNGDSVVDIFEKEVTVKVTSDSPIKIDTETKTNENP